MVDVVSRVASGCPLRRSGRKSFHSSRLAYLEAGSRARKRGIIAPCLLFWSCACVSSVIITDPLSSSAFPVPSSPEQVPWESYLVRHTVLTLVVSDTWSRVWDIDKSCVISELCLHWCFPFLASRWLSSDEQSKRMNSVEQSKRMNSDEQSRRTNSYVQSSEELPL